MRYIFEQPLIEGTIVKRKSQFTMVVNMDGTEYNCHCPTTGRIGDLEVKGLACLVSKSSDPKRKTPYTVEAVSVAVCAAIEKDGVSLLSCKNTTSNL